MGEERRKFERRVEEVSYTEGTTVRETKRAGAVVESSSWAALVSGRPYLAWQTLFPCSLLSRGVELEAPCRQPPPTGWGLSNGPKGRKGPKGPKHDGTPPPPPSAWTLEMLLNATKLISLFGPALPLPSNPPGRKWYAQSHLILLEPCRVAQSTTQRG